MQLLDENVLKKQEEIGKNYNKICPLFTFYSAYSSIK